MTRAEKAELYNLLIASQPGADRKGATIPYTSLNGHMYSMFTKSDTVAIRLSATEREKFMKQYGAPQLEQYGVVQKEYVVVPDDLLRQTELLLPWFQLSYNYAASLKPKAAAGSAGKKKK